MITDGVRAPAAGLCANDTLPETVPAWPPPRACSLPLPFERATEPLAAPLVVRVSPPPLPEALRFNPNSLPLAEPPRPQAAGEPPRPPPPPCVPPWLDITAGL
ncbi:hypothetical protein BTUL_0223g00060 [Botrytis tulipae]|uniref:Uncharacterized protein n=1 Tax=Botrytis tulipae TaxID=87230 RepID=A0A4Z1EFK9_9HELO|nr:hypothetical protein BTUL_0223g00060 [Botrytis tulipae]